MLFFFQIPFVLVQYYNKKTKYDTIFFTLQNFSTGLHFSHCLQIEDLIFEKEGGRQFNEWNGKGKSKIRPFAK